MLNKNDDFAREVSLVRQNKDLIKLLNKRSKETKIFTLSQVRDRINFQQDKIKKWY